MAGMAQNQFFAKLIDPNAAFTVIVVSATLDTAVFNQFQ